MSPLKERKSLKPGTLRHAFIWIGCAIVISLLVAAVVRPSWTTLGIAVLFGIAFVLLVTMPVFLAVISGHDEKKS